MACDIALPVTSATLSKSSWVSNGFVTAPSAPAADNSASSTPF
jgi:hypothetical protein